MNLDTKTGLPSTLQTAINKLCVFAAAYPALAEGVRYIDAGEDVVLRWAYGMPYQTLQDVAKAHKDLPWTRDRVSSILFDWKAKVGDVVVVLPGAEQIELKYESAKIEFL